MPERLKLRASGAEPLRRGFVELADGAPASVYARCRCVVDGARPHTRYEVTLLVHLFDPTGSNVPARFASASFETDDDGHGSMQLVIRSEDVPPAVRGAAHGVRWVVATGGSAVFQTDCRTVTLRESDTGFDTQDPATGSTPMPAVS